ncbi:transcript variant X2 [Nothobranchius furzeri]|uniref:Transcript variant X2 n=1 Tax=Nothobranchius furzeri TaxID=105023 RepID=A0A9D2XS16_NOTFU|nr:transcript variant X2 [Nothobranchius furzeri]
MLAPLLLLLCLSEQIRAQNPPDVECLIVNQEQVHCVWNKNGAPGVNYTFSSWFENNKESNCTNYLIEDNITIGCKRDCKREDKFSDFYTILRHGNETKSKKIHALKKKVKLNPPTNVTVKIGSDSNLWFYWNQSTPRCVDNQVRFRINNKPWDSTHVPSERLSYCINLPSSNSRYEFQVKSKITESCGDSDIWSDWSDPVAWGFNNSTNTNIKEPISVWTPVLYVVGAITLILLIIMLLRHERLRIILIPVVPKPLLSSPEIELPVGQKTSPLQVEGHPPTSVWPLGLVSVLQRPDERRFQSQLQRAGLPCTRVRLCLPL